MNPWPIVHTELVILRLLLKRLPTQLLSMLCSMVCVGGVAFLALAIKKQLFVGTTLKTLSVSSVAPAALLAVGLFIVFSSASGLMWRSADRKLLAGSPVSSLPVALLLQGMIYILMIVAGGGIITYSALHYLSPHLASLGLASPWDHVILIVPLALGYGALFLRLVLLLPLIGLDRQKVVPGWHLVMRTTVGKSIPLGVGLLVQLLLCAPFLIAFALAVLPSFQKVPLAQLNTSYLTAHPTPTVAGALLLALAYLVLTTLQAAMLRHFFGYGLAGDPRYDDDHIILPEEIAPAEMNPVLLGEEESYLMAPSPVLPDTSIFTEDEPELMASPFAEEGLAPPSSAERLEEPPFAGGVREEAPFFAGSAPEPEAPLLMDEPDVPALDSAPRAPVTGSKAEAPLLPEASGRPEDEDAGFNFDVEL